MKSPSSRPAIPRTDGLTTRRLGAASLGFIALALVGGCNVVITDKPLFTQADVTGAPPLRPGVWSFFHEAGCKVDESQPYATWPDCSGGGVVRDGEVAGRDKKSGALERMPLIIASGDPRILQVQIKIDVSAGAEATASGGAQASASATAQSPREQPYGYAGLKPTKFDGQGRITAFRFWPVQCGPLPAHPKADNRLFTVTEHPLPGLEMKPGESSCTTHSVAALRNAARASEAWDTDHQQSHWVRDGEQ